MSRSINRVTLLGHLGKDPEKRTTQTGKTVVTFSVATGFSTKDKDTGKVKETTAWHNIVVLNEGALAVCDYLRRGSRCLVEGAVQYRSYTDKTGVERTVTEIVVGGLNGQIVLLDGKPAGYRDDDLPDFTR